MGQIEHQPDSKLENGRSVETVLQTVTQDLMRLHHGLVDQLSQEVNQLQSEKARLREEVETLRSQYRALQSQQLTSLSQQQIAQQQLWAKQLAMALANHLQGLMIQQMRQVAKANQLAGNPLASNQLAGNSPANLAESSQAHSDNAHRLLVSLDTTFSTTFKALQQELTSYHSSLSQQLGRMHSMEQQGEAVLVALVQRLQEQLQIEMARQSAPAQSPSLMQENGNPAQRLGYAELASGERSPSHPGHSAQPHSVSSHPSHTAAPNYQPQPHSSSSYSAHSSTQTYPPQNHSPQGQLRQGGLSQPLVFPDTPLPAQPVRKKELSSFWLGLILVLLSTVALSIHNVVVRLIGKPSSILGLPEIGGFINITVLGNSLLILWLRMLVVLPLMLVLATLLYPTVWRDLRKFFALGDRRPIFNVVGSGFFLFLSQVLIYIAIGQIGAGPAVTILFMYPLVTVPLAWFLFGDRPTLLRWGVMGIISLGVVLTALPSIDPSKMAAGGAVGVITAIVAGITFALYLIFMQLGFKKLHPVPVSLVQFFTIFVLSAMILILAGPDLGVVVEADKRMGFIASGLILGSLTLVGYLANNFGVRFMGAALASIIASIGPVMTALLAWVLIRNPLQGIQVLGIVFVTLGVGALSIERMKLQTKSAKK